MYARIVNLQQQPHLELGREQKKKSKGRKKSYYTKAILFHSQKLKSKTSNQAKWILTKIIVTQFHIYILSRSTDARSIQLSLVTSSILTTCFLIIRRLAGREPQGVGSLWWSVKQLGSTISIILNHTVWVNNHCDAQSYSLGEWSLWCSIIQSGWMITVMLSVWVNDHWDAVWVNENCDTQSYNLGEISQWYPIIQSGWMIVVYSIIQPGWTISVISNHTVCMNDQCDIQSYSLREWSVWYSIIQTGWMTTAIPNHTVWVNDYCILNHTVCVNDQCDTQSYKLDEWPLRYPIIQSGWMITVYSIIQSGWMITVIPNHTDWVNGHCGTPPQNLGGKQCYFCPTMGRRWFDSVDTRIFCQPWHWQGLKAAVLPSNLGMTCYSAELQFFPTTQNQCQSYPELTV